MALRYSTLGGTNLPKQFDYEPDEPRRVTNVPTQRSAALFMETGLVEKDQLIRWRCPDCTRTELETIRDLYRVLDPYYLFVGAQDPVDDRYYVEFTNFDPPRTRDGLYQLTGSFRVVERANADASITVTDYTQLSGAVVTIVMWDGVSNTTTTFTEGVDWTAATSNAATAQSIEAALDTVTGASAVTSGNVVIVTADSGYAISNLTLTGGTGASVDLDFEMDFWALASLGFYTARMVT